MKKRLMTLSDLYNYYSTQGKTQKFNCKKTGEPITVQVDGKLSFSKSDAMEGLYPTRVQLNFIGDNLNGSRIEMKAQEDALPSSKYRPLLAYIHDVDGEPQFYGHNMHIDDEGELVYDEQPVGVIAEEAHIEHDDEYDKDYAVANGYIWEEYSKAAYILERDQKCDVSVELSIRSLSYSAKDKILVLEDFYYSGCSILGYDEEGNKVKPAMPGSNITLADFSANNADSDKLDQISNQLKELIAKFESIQNTSRKEDVPVADKVELMEDVEKTVVQEEIAEDTVETTEEEVAEVVLESTEETEATPEEVENVEENMTVIEEEVPINEYSVKFAVTNGENTKEFSLSLNDKLYAMNSLVNETYGELDNDWYDVQVFEDDKIVEMYGWFSGKAYRQSYKTKKDNFQLIGDRTEIFCKYLSQDEINALEKLKADYSELQATYAEKAELLEKYESEPSKMEVLNSTKYSYVAGTEEFDELVNNHFDLSVEDVTKKADEILLSYAESGSLKFSVEDNKEQRSVRPIPIIENKKKTGRYGDLFSR